MKTTIFALALLVALSLVGAAPIVLDVQQHGDLMGQGGPEAPPTGAFNISISAKDASGVLIEDALIHARLWHVNGLNYFTTDIPYVEGEPVFDLTTVATDGQMHIDAMTPVYGTYRLEVRAVDPTGKNEAADSEQELVASNMPEKDLRGALLLWFLLLAGLFGGYYFLSEGNHD